MKPLVQLFSLLCLAAIAIPAFMLWNTTGGRLFTSLPSQGLSTMAQQEGTLTNLFGGQPAQPPMENSFALGLLPGGGGAHVASVSTFVAPALFLTMAAFFRRGKLLKKV